MGNAVCQLNSKIFHIAGKQIDVFAKNDNKKILDKIPTSKKSVISVFMVTFQQKKSVLLTI